MTKHVEIPYTEYIDQGVGVPFVIQRQAPQIQTVLKTVEALPVLFLLEHSVNGVERAREVWAARCALLLEKKPGVEPAGEAFKSFIGDGFQVLELKDESESFGGRNVNNEALHVIGLYGSCDKISFFLQDWVAKVALSCHMALDVL